MKYGILLLMLMCQTSASRGYIVGVDQGSILLGWLFVMAYFAWVFEGAK